MRPIIEYEIKHTSISYLSPKEIKKIPYLKDNEGAMPPLVIAVGDARRVARARSALGLKKVLVLHEQSERLLGLTGKGRVDLVIGLYRYRSKDIPLLLVETQMGMPATDIILREVLSHCHLRYNFGGSFIETEGIYIIRAGTAGGINSKTGRKVKIGDMVNAEFSIGWSGAILQALGGLDYSSNDVIDEFKKKWTAAGNSFTHDGKFPMAKNSAELVKAIESAAAALNISSHKGGNFSKDSLFAEMNTEAFIELRERYNIMSTEMEQMILGKLTGDFKNAGTLLNTGLISGVIGLIPGKTSAYEASDKSAIDKVEEKTLRVAATALWTIVHGGKK